MHFAGKRELLTPDLSSYLNDIQVPDMDKRAPARFFGMRGKKGPSSQSFFGMRGKKDFDLLTEPQWYPRGSDEMSRLLIALNEEDAGRAKRDVSGEVVVVVVALGWLLIKMFR